MKTMINMSPSIEESEKLEHFIGKIDKGEKIEADDWMPDEYRIDVD